MENLRNNPFLFLLSFLIMGIFMYISMNIPFFFAICFTAIALTTLLLYKLLTHNSFKRKISLHILYIIPIALLLMAGGMTLAHIKTKQVKSDFTDQKALFTMTIMDKPIEKPNSFLCKAKITHKLLNDSSFSARGNVIIYVQKDSLSASISEGDILLCHTVFPAYRPSGNPDVLDYNNYLFKQSISSTAYIPADKWKRVGKDTSFSIIKTAHNCRNFLMNIYKKYNIKEQNLAVLAALTLGDKQQLDPDTKMAYSASGAMHILAVSGLHVGIIYAILYLFLYPLRKRKNNSLISSLIIFIALWCYAFITGLSPSVLRATIMLSVILIGKASGRKSYIYNTIALSAFLLLIYNPFYLYHVGFQLSYSAVLAIVFLQPKLYKLCYLPNKILNYIWGLITVSIAAHIGTFIWSLLYFHQFSTYFLLTNLIVIPIATIILYSAALFFLFAFIPFIPQCLALILNAELSILNAFVKWIEHLPLSIIPCFINKYQAILLVICIVGILFAITLDNKYKLWAIIVSASALLCLFINVLVQLYNLNEQQKIVVYNAGNKPIIQIIEGRHSTIYANDSTSVNYYTKNFTMKHKANNVYNLLDENTIKGFIFKGKKYCILQGDILHNKLTNDRLITDYLIMADIKNTYIEEITAMIKAENIIITPALNAWKSKKLIEYCINNKINYTDIRNTGAYISE
ncbi:MAG: ComEC/Rec2 family competence protein [Paludibacteraceae bacterium]|nr:ComEC/Rec2 family competence protein [Paludibacteraceae bacterium]